MLIQAGSMIMVHEDERGKGMQELLDLRFLTLGSANNHM